MTEYIIRKFEPQDLDQILELFCNTVHTINSKDYSAEQINAWAPQQLDKERWASEFTEHITYVAIKDAHIVGFGDATQDGEIDRLYTHKDFQGQGIASAILKKLEEELAALGITEVTTQASITAKPFFEKCGYAVMQSQEMKHRSGVIFLNYVMNKKLV